MRTIVILFIECFVVAILYAEPQVHTVLVKTRVNAQWKTYPTRTLSDLPVNATQRLDSGLDPFGGLLACKLHATGFFYPTNFNGRWWLVDPRGCLFLDVGMDSVRTGPRPELDAARAFGSQSNWAAQTTSLLRANGFNNLGAWSDTASLRQVSPPLSYTLILNFMSSYGAKRGGTFQQPGHTGYPENCIFVFDPGFETFCDEHARKLAQLKSDPWLLGYFSDNEMPLNQTALKDYLRLPPQDPGYQAAANWLKERHGKNATADKITLTDERDFLALVVGRYFSIVSSAIKKYDPNHLFLGSRFHGRVLAEPEVFKAAGPYVDVISVNYYNAWTPSPARLSMWEHESGRPVLISEWYTKAEDSGMDNTGGAGWIVKTQADRGSFYQNFALALLQSKSCIGWNWFKYADNDPNDKSADPSNQDSNKGIVNAHFKPYQPLLNAMKDLNARAYSLADYFNGN
jgi:hypothetical protein